MSGSAQILIELVLVFGLAFGWGLNELRLLRRDRAARDEDEAGRPTRADRPDADG